MRKTLLLLVAPFLAACAVEGVDTTTDDGVERGGLGKADLVGSCETPHDDRCGGRGTGNCWCDDACIDYGDCCSDAGEVCGIEPPPPEGEDCGGLLGLTCGEGEFCNYAPEHMCGAADHLGTCEPMPEVCIELFAPVCGCDGNTYSNSCFAAGAGTSVVHEGECEPPPPGQFCGGIAGIQCPEGQICVDDGNDDCDPALGGADCGGVCVLEPAECEPVLCALFCEHGFATDEDGCEVCECADEPPPPVEPECKVAGCSSEMCVPLDGPDFSICIFEPWYTCLDLTDCGVQDDGACGWTPTPEYLNCLASFGQ